MRICACCGRNWIRRGCIAEVMAGFGLAGRWFAIQHWDVEPDLIAMGKGTTGGYFPLSVTAVRGEWADAIVDGSPGQQGALPACGPLRPAGGGCCFET